MVRKYTPVALNPYLWNRSPLFNDFFMLPLHLAPNDPCLVAVARTPIGSMGGSLASLSATALGSTAIAAALERAGLKASAGNADTAQGEEGRIHGIDEVYMGNVLSAGLGQAPATQAAVGAGISRLTPFTTVNKVCASGMKAVMLAAQSIELGQNRVVVAGGMESMSQVPYYLDKARNGYRFGHGQLVDGILKDGLWDVYHQYHMGNAAELCARELNISRDAQDAYAVESYRRAAAAWSAGKFAAELAPVTVPGPKGSTTAVTEDEDYTKVNFDKIPCLKPVFEKEGTVTAANASNLNDGASALVLMSYAEAQARGLQPLARILGYADAQQAPEWFTTAPSKAIPLALHRAGITADQVDFYEINEAFSVVCLANNQLLGLDPSKVNVYGGGVSIGHPIGSSGCRILVTLTSVLHQEGGRIGVAGICNGGGGASAMVLEKLD
jgi:acetyl-CoA C-acetyltransferase